MDMWDREVISYGVSKRSSAENIMNVYRFKLKKNKIFQSMFKKGNCHNNLVIKNFFRVMKQEMYYGVVHYNYEGLKEAIDNYVKYYNKKRMKKTRMDESSRIQTQLFGCIKNYVAAKKLLRNKV